MTDLSVIEPPCPTEAGAPCGCCPSCIALQIKSLAVEARHGSPSDLDVPA